MSNYPTDEIVDHQILFAAIQTPETLEQGQRVASLAPLMDLDTGRMLSAVPRDFPSDGSVFWWDVPTDQFSPGDLIVGKLGQSPRYYGSPDKNWYQVQGNEGHQAKGEVFCYVRVPLQEDESLRCLVDGRKPIAVTFCDKQLFYVWTNHALVGPFVPENFDGSGPKKYVCKPSDRAGHAVNVLTGSAIAKFVENDGGFCEAVVGGRGTERKTHKYLLIRPQEIEELADNLESIMLPPDDDVIAKVCKRIEGRKKSREARDDFQKLVRLLVEDEKAEREGLATAMQEMLGRIESINVDTKALVDAVVRSGKFDTQINEAVASRVEEICLERNTEIDERTKTLSKELTAKTDAARDELDNVENSLQNSRKQLNSLAIKISDRENALDELVSAAEDRLKNHRNELLADLSLFLPLFQANSSSMAKAEQNKLVEHCHDSPPTGPALAEQDFINNRLTPLLRSHGCDFVLKHAELFHALLIAANAVHVPHPGWAVAYAEALGNGELFVTSVEPRWLSFEDACKSDLPGAWEHAQQNPESIVIVLMDGIDACPSHAWLQPFIHSIAGWRQNLPSPISSEWPQNLRLLLCSHESSASFEIPDFLKKWAIKFESSSNVKNATQFEFVEGHLPASEWLLENSNANTEHGISEEVLTIASSEAKQYHSKVVRRLATVLARLDNDADRVPHLVQWLLRNMGATECDE